ALFRSRAGKLLRCAGLYQSRVALIPGSSMAEHSAVNRGVAGSSPARGANAEARGFRLGLFAFLPWGPAGVSEPRSSGGEMWGKSRPEGSAAPALRQRRRVAGGEALLDDVVIVEVGVVGAVAAPGTPAAQRLFHAAQQYLRLQLLGGLEQREDRFRLPAGGFVDAVAVHHLVHRHRVTPPSG